MTSDEEAVLKEADDIIKSALEARSEAQSQEHIRAMPHLYKMAQQLILQSPNPDSPVHLLIIKEAGEDADLSELQNPLGIDQSDGGARAAEFSLVHSWESYEDACDHLRNPIASLLYNEARKKSGGQALFLVTKEKLCANYVGHKLTVSRHTIGDDLMTWHTSVARDNDPDGFFDKCQATQDEKVLVTSLIAMGESAALMEQDNPKVYGVMLKRVKETLEDIRDDDDFLGD